MLVTLKLGLVENWV